jgi:hypothetical protein
VKNPSNHPLTVDFHKRMWQACDKRKNSLYSRNRAEKLRNRRKNSVYGGIPRQKVANLHAIRGKIPSIPRIEDRNFEIEGKIPLMMEHDRKRQA